MWRRNAITDAQWRGYLGFVFVVGFFFVFLFTWFCFSGYDWYKFHSHGRLTKAVILKKETMDSEDSDSYHYQVSYFSDSVRVRIVGYGNYGNVGDTIDIYYLANERNAEFPDKIISGRDPLLLGTGSCIALLILFWGYFNPAPILFSGGDKTD